MWAVNVSSCVQLSPTWKWLSVTKVDPLSAQQNSTATTTRAEWHHTPGCHILIRLGYVCPAGAQNVRARGGFVAGGNHLLDPGLTDFDERTSIFGLRSSTPSGGFNSNLEGLSLVIGRLINLPPAQPFTSAERPQITLRMGSCVLVHSF